MPKHNAFTIKYNGKVRVLVTKAKIGLPFSLEELKKRTEAGEKIEFKEYIAIWDTGATNCVITKKIVDELGLKPIKIVEVNHAGGKSNSNVYLVNIGLPSNVLVGAVEVTEGILTSGTGNPDNEPNILIGMDIIGGGDFAVTNKNGKTMMSFKIPSTQEIDFVPISEQMNITGEVGNRHQRRVLEAQLRKKNKKKW